jgi:hypothetical protein
MASDSFFLGHAFLGGIIMNFTVAIAMMILTQISIYLFTRTWEFGRTYAYNEVWRNTFGPSLQWLPTLMVLITYFSYVCETILEIEWLFTELWTYIFSETPTILNNPWFLKYGSAILFIVPGLLVTSLRQLKMVAVIGSLGTILGIVALLLNVARVADQEPIFPVPPVVIWGPNLDYLSESFKIYSGLFLLHPFLVFILKDLHNPTVSRCINVTLTSNIICLTIAMVMGLLSWLMAPWAAPNEFVFDEMDTALPEVRMGQVAALIVDLASACFFTYFIARSIVSTILPNSTGERAPTFLAGTCAITGYVLVGCAGAKVLDILNAVAAVFAGLIGFCFPPLFIFRQYGCIRMNWAWMAGAVFIVGTPLTILMMVLRIQDISAAWSQV